MAHPTNQTEPKKTTREKAAALLKELDALDNDDNYVEDCARCGTTGRVVSIHDEMRCPDCGGLGITLDTDRLRQDKVELIAAFLRPAATNQEQSK